MQRTLRIFVALNVVAKVVLYFMFSYVELFIPLMAKSSLVYVYNKSLIAHGAHMSIETILTDPYQIAKCIKVKVYHIKINLKNFLYYYDSLNFCLLFLLISIPF